jgi:hypothetical protein
MSSACPQAGMSVEKHKIAMRIAAARKDIQNPKPPRNEEATASRYEQDSYHSGEGKLKRGAVTTPPRLESRFGFRVGQIDLTRLFYLRAAQAYMLISMPTGTSTIFGVFQVIQISHSRRVLRARGK